MAAELFPITTEKYDDSTSADSLASCGGCGGCGGCSGSQLMSVKHHEVLPPVERAEVTRQLADIALDFDLPTDLQ